MQWQRPARAYPKPQQLSAGDSRPGRDPVELADRGLLWRLVDQSFHDGLERLALYMQTDRVRGEGSANRGSLP